MQHRDKLGGLKNFKDEAQIEVLGKIEVNSRTLWLVPPKYPYVGILHYPYMAYNQEMRRLYQQGAVGAYRYGEAEYVHPDPAEVKLGRSVGLDHWRNWIPATYCKLPGSF